MVEASNVEVLDKSRRLARRWMGWLAFGALLVEHVFLLVATLRGGPEWAANLKAAEPLLTTLDWTLTLIVLGYLGVSVTEAISKRKG